MQKHKSRLLKLGDQQENRHTVVISSCKVMNDVKTEFTNSDIVLVEKVMSKEKIKIENGTINNYKISSIQIL